MEDDRSTIPTQILNTPLENKYSSIRDAIRNKYRIYFDYQGRERVVCPHVLGWKNGELKVFGRLLQHPNSSSESQKEIPQDGTWRCFFVEQIPDLKIKSAEAWISGPGSLDASSCIDISEVTVES